MSEGGFPRIPHFIKPETLLIYHQNYKKHLKTRISSTRAFGKQWWWESKAILNTSPRRYAAFSDFSPNVLALKNTALKSPIDTRESILGVSDVLGAMPDRERAPLIRTLWRHLKYVKVCPQKISIPFSFLESFECWVEFAFTLSN